MTPDERHAFRSTVRNAIAGSTSSKYDDILDLVNDELRDLVRQGIVGYGADHILAGDALEARVRQLLEGMAFVVNDGRSDLEDFVLPVPAGFKPDVPVVLEVKSSKKSASPNRDDLRQLDDWVFELSGEEKARKEGLRLGMGHLQAMQDYRIVYSPPVNHPTPHKGVMIFNGPNELPFDQRRPNWLGANEEQFAIKRNFCIISLESLVAWSSKYAVDPKSTLAFWQAIHATAGVLGNS